MCLPSSNFKAPRLMEFCSSAPYITADAKVSLCELLIHFLNWYRNRKVLYRTIGGKLFLAECGEKDEGHCCNY